MMDTYQNVPHNETNNRQTNKFELFHHARYSFHVNLSPNNQLRLIIVLFGFRFIANPANFTFMTKLTMMGIGETTFDYSRKHGVNSQADFMFKVRRMIGSIVTAYYIQAYNKVFKFKTWIFIKLQVDRSFIKLPYVITEICNSSRGKSHQLLLLLHIVSIVILRLCPRF